MTFLDEIRTNMRSSIARYLDLPNPPLFNLHVNSFAGAGKTTIACEELENADAFFIYLTNNHSIGSEQLEKHEALYDLQHIESRKRLCLNKDYQYLADFGINIKHFCRECPHINICEYYQRMIEIWKEPQSWVGVHHHLGGLVNDYCNEYNLDCVVIDEYFLGAIYKQTQFGYPNIISSMNLLSTMPDSREKQLILDYLQEFAFGIQNNKINTDFLHSQTFHYFYHGGSNILLRAFSDEFEIRLAHFYFKKSKIFKNSITPLVEAIININDHYIPTRADPKRDPEVYLKYINSVIQLRIGQKKKLIDIAHYDLDALNIPCKVLLLDATTPTELYQRVFDRKLNHIVDNIPLNSKIYQISTAKYVMQTLDRSTETRDRLVNIVKLVAEKHNEPILVVSRKKYEEVIKDSNPTLITTDHYPLVGSNEYEKMNTIVIFGTPEPRRDVLHRKAELLHYNEDDLLYVMREANVIQAIHRIRPAIKEELTYVYLLTNLNLPISNINHISIGKLEKLLRNESTSYITEDNEDRIRDEIYTILKQDELPISELLDLIQGNRAIVTEILKRMINEGVVETYKVNTAGKGRKPVYLRISE